MHLRRGSVLIVSTKHGRYTILENPSNEDRRRVLDDAMDGAIHRGERWVVAYTAEYPGRLVFMTQSGEDSRGFAASRDLREVINDEMQHTKSPVVKAWIARHEASGGRIAVQVLRHPDEMPNAGHLNLVH